MSAGSVFVDTNILVYAVDASEPAKRERARRALADPAPLVVSTQVLQELYVALTRGAAPILTATDAEIAVREAARLRTVQVDRDLVLEAIGLHRAGSLSFWDALIVAAARAGGCDVLWSEDLQDGAVHAGVRVRNPLAEER